MSKKDANFARLGYFLVTLVIVYIFHQFMGLEMVEKFLKPFNWFLVDIKFVLEVLVIYLVAGKLRFIKK